MEDNLDFGYMQDLGPDVNINDLGRSEINPDLSFIYENERAKANQKGVEPLKSVSNGLDTYSSFNTNPFSDIPIDNGETSLYGSGIDVNEMYTTLSDGSLITRYDEGFIKGTDNEQRYADNQSTTSKWANGLSKFALKTLNNVVGGTVGTVVGTVSAIGSGNWENIYDNSFMDMLDDYNKMSDNMLANYRSQEERDMNFFESATTANFWADDFLGGMSFLTGTILSEGIWAAATGGTSLTTTLARQGLRATKHAKTLGILGKGLKSTSKPVTKMLTKGAVKEGVDLGVKNAIRGGQVGKVLDLARFTYTGAGFEAGMEARLYQREQTENFYKDFEKLNGRKPNAEDIVAFEKELGSTTNMLFATNMALVGTSNFAILGKSFGMKSPFSLPKTKLNKFLYGKGVREVVEGTEKTIKSRGVQEAIKKTKAQRALGFTTGLLKNPFYEGIVEEGGQATASSMMENYLKSRYNPDVEVLDMVESFSDAFAHTYGTKEGWKEVGLGMLIGFIGGEMSNVASKQGFLTDAREGLKEVDTNSKAKADNMNENLGTNVLNKFMGHRVNEAFIHASQVSEATQALKNAEENGDIMEASSAQNRLLLLSVQNAENHGYLEEQLEDYNNALKMKAQSKEDGSRSELAEYYDIDQSEVSEKVQELSNKFSKVAELNKEATQFAEYIISDNPKEIDELEKKIGTSDIQSIRMAIAYQSVMTNLMEEDLREAHKVILENVAELVPGLQEKYSTAMTELTSLKKAKEEKVQERHKLETQIKNIKNRIGKINSAMVLNENKDNKKVSSQLLPLQNELLVLESKLAEINKSFDRNQSTIEFTPKVQKLVNELDQIDPLTTSNSVPTVESTMNSIKELHKLMKESNNPMLVHKIEKLTSEYYKGLSMWKRNADTMKSLADPKVGLKKVGHMFKGHKNANESTVKLLKTLRKTQTEDLILARQEFEKVKETKVEEDDKNNNNQKVDADPGVNPKVQKQTDTEGKETTVETLKRNLRNIIEKNPYLLEKFSKDGKLSFDNRPTMEDIQEYQGLRDKFKSGDINKLIGRSPEIEGNEGGIGKRVKERSGLSNEEILRYQELTDKMTEWRVVLGANEGNNKRGMSIQDMLDIIEAEEQTESGETTILTAEQQVEIVDTANKEYNIGANNKNMVQTMTYVNVGKNEDNMEISHMQLDTFEKAGLEIVQGEDRNIGKGDAPILQEIYYVTAENGNKYTIYKNKDNSRLIIDKKDFNNFLGELGYKSLSYKLKTAWGYLFGPDGRLLKSDFNIEDPNNESFHTDEIYKLNPGAKVGFSVSMTNNYNNETINKLIEQGDEESAKANLAIYITTQDGKTLGLLKAGKENGTNFQQIREKAFELYLEKLNEESDLLSDIARDNTDSSFNLPFTTEVEKIFVGTPNLQLNENQEATAYSITKKQSKNYIVEHGFSKKGKLSKKDDSIRMTFIPKDVNTPYVVIQQEETKIAFPVGLIPKDLGNGMTKEYSKEEVVAMSKEDFTDKAQIIINLDDKAFVSPKIKLNLSKEFVNIETGENNKEKIPTIETKLQLILNNQDELAKAKTEEEVMSLIAELSLKEPLLAKFFDENPSFKQEVINFALNNSTVPVINTLDDIKELLKDIVELENAGIPLELKEDITEELNNLKESLTDEALTNLAVKVRNSLKEKYRTVPGKVNTDSLYYVNTHKSNEEMFNEQGEEHFVHITGDFYRKVQLIEKDDFLNSIYNQFNNDLLPEHIKFDSLEDLKLKVNNMPLLNLYEFYYNTQDKFPLSKQAVVLSNIDYLKGTSEESFKDDFTKFINQNENVQLKNEVLQHFDIEGPSIKVRSTFTREILDKHQKELGSFYKGLLEYSLINKQIDLKESNNIPIFTGSQEEMERLTALNNSNLPKIKGEIKLKNSDTIKLDSRNSSKYIQHKGAVYEQTAESMWTKIGEQDPNFIVTEYNDPYNNELIQDNNDKIENRTSIKESEGTELNCKKK